jgi:AAA domain
MATMNHALANAQTVRIPKGLVPVSTNPEHLQYFRGVLYAGTGDYKTTTAAEFGGPEHTLIVLTRSIEQLIPLGPGYHVVQAQTPDALRWALLNPDAAADAANFPQWKTDPDRVLVVDDLTEGIAMIVDDNETDDQGRERGDGRQVYKYVNGDIRTILSSLKKRKLHLIMTALASVFPSEVANEETVYPDMPKGARGLITAEVEFVFYIDRVNKKMITEPDAIQCVKKDERGKDKPGLRTIFAKSKLPNRQKLGKVDLNLRAAWEKIRAVAK